RHNRENLRCGGSILERRVASSNRHATVIVRRGGARYADIVMQAPPARLTPKRFALLRELPKDGDDTLWGGIVWSRGHVLRRLRVFRRGLMALAWTLLLMPVQAVLIVLPGHAKVALPRLYWAGMCRVLGLRVRVIGAPAHRTADGRPVVFVSNHSSWLDVLVLGGTLEACFIAKGEVA